jgi:hypothetical protein
VYVTIGRTMTGFPSWDLVWFHPKMIGLRCVAVLVLVIPAE